MNFKRVFLLLIITFTASACAKHTTIRHSNNYDSVIARSNRVAVVLPPEAEVNMVEFSGKKKRAYDYELHLESIIIDELIPALREENIQAIYLNRRALHDQDLVHSAGRTKERYNELRDKLYKNIALEEKIAFDINESIGPVASEISIKNHADLIVIIDFARNIKTSGARTADFVLDMAFNGSRSKEADKSILIIGILDCQTGKFLWSNLSVNIKGTIASAMDNSNDEDKLMHEKLSSMIKDLFAQFKQENNQ